MAQRAARLISSSASDCGSPPARPAAVILGFLALLFYTVIPAGFMPMTGADGIVRIMPCPQQNGPVVTAPADHAGAGHAMAMPDDGGKSQPASNPVQSSDHGKCAFSAHASFASPSPVVLAGAMVWMDRLAVRPLAPSRLRVAAFPPRPLGQAPPAIV